MTNNITITGNGKKVTISTEKVEYIITNPAKVLTFPQSTSTGSVDGAKTSKILNLYKTGIRIHVDGKIQDGLGTASPEQNDASDKWDDLVYMCKRGGDKKKILALNYKGEDYQAFIDKLTLTEEPGEEKATASMKYTIKFTSVIGEGM